MQAGVRVRLSTASYPPGGKADQATTTVVQYLQLA